MIFKNISDIRTKSDRLFLQELVTIYCGIVREVSRTSSIVFTEKERLDSSEVLKELFSMGILLTREQLPLLKRELKGRYSEFIWAINTYIENRDIFGNILDKLSNSKRQLAQRNEFVLRKPQIVDFFAGAGGLSLGFTQSGFGVCLANDFEEVCVNTYRYNHPEVPSERVIQDDIRSIVDDIHNHINGESVDVVIGGPPCQGFSSANQQRIIYDPRNELYKYFLKGVERILPKFVVMENVRGMLSVAEQVVEDFTSIKVVRQGKEYSYIVGYQVLNSVDFSVAQNRERLFYIAIRNDVSISKKITPKTIFEEIKRECEANPKFVLSDALEGIKPLEAPREKNQNEIDSEISGKKVDWNRYSSVMNPYLKVINNGQECPLIFNHKARFVNETNYEIYRLLEQGDDASNYKIAGIMPYSNRLHCFKDKYYKLIANRPSRTITAHLRMDCHSHIHPEQVRAITPREAARVQSFPDNYVFLGAYLKTYMQIGNAVPVLMGKGIASVIKKYI